MSTHTSISADDIRVVLEPDFSQLYSCGICRDNLKGLAETESINLKNVNNKC